MIDSLLKQYKQVDIYVSMVPKLQDDKLTVQDWKDLEVMELLGSFKYLTMIK